MITSPRCSRDASRSVRMDRLGIMAAPDRPRASRCRGHPLDGQGEPASGGPSQRAWCPKFGSRCSHAEPAYAVRTAPWHTRCESFWCSSDRSRAQRHLTSIATSSFGHVAVGRCPSLVKRNTLSNGTLTRRTGLFRTAIVVMNPSRWIAASCHLGWHENAQLPRGTIAPEARRLSKSTG